MRRPVALLPAMPAVFVLLWSTGFVVARYAMPHAPPLKFLCVRYALSVLAFVLWARLAHAQWPHERSQWRHLAVTGVLMQAGYLGGVWTAVHEGLGAGTVSLIVGLQPVLTALWLGRVGGAASRRASPRQWLGLSLGLAGLLLVVAPKLGAGEVTTASLVPALLALLAITAGTLYQKRYLQPCDVRTAVCIQMLAALAVSAPLALLESAPVVWHPQLIGALAWSVLVLTLGASSLLYMLIQRGAATEVVSLLYLVPPCTALMGWVLFAEPLGGTVLPGLGLTAIGVALVVRTPRVL